MVDLPPSTEVRIGVHALRDGHMSVAATATTRTGERLTAVSNLRVADATETGVTVTWDVPQDAHRHGFDLFVDETWIGWINDPRARAHTFTGLEAQTDYVLGVTATGLATDGWPAQPYSRRTRVAAHTTADPDAIGGSEACTGSTEALCVEWPHGFVDRRAGDPTPIVLNGVNIQDGVNARWHYPITRMRTADAPDFNAVRIALDWPIMEPAAGQFDTDAFAQLDAMIAEAATADIHVILDPLHVRRQRSSIWNQQPGSTWNLPGWAWSAIGVPVASTRGQELNDAYNCGVDDVLAAHAEAYLTEVVDRYADNPTVWPLISSTSPATAAGGSPGKPRRRWRARNNCRHAGGLDADLRKIDPDKVLIAEPMYGDFDPTRLDLSGIAVHSNVMWSLHDYFAGVGAPYAASGLVDTTAERAESCALTCYDPAVAVRAERVADQAALLDATITALDEYELVVFIGEYGYHTDGEHVGAAFEDKASLYADRGLSRTAWVMNYDGPGFQLHSSAGWHPLAALLA